MTRQLMIFVNAVTACAVAAKVAFAYADRNWDAAHGWSIALLWIFISMIGWIGELKEGGAEPSNRPTVQPSNGEGTDL